MAEHPAIRSQVDVIDIKQPKDSHAKATTATRDPPSMEELSLHFGSQEEAQRIQGQIINILVPRGLQWEHDVSQIVQSYDMPSLMLADEYMHSLNFAKAVISKRSTVQDLWNALEKMLANTPILMSFCVTDRISDLHYVQIKPSKKLYDLCISHYPPVETVEEAQHLAVRIPFQDHARLPGPLFRCILFHVEETNSAAFVVYIHHACYDASLMCKILGDLEQAIQHPDRPLHPHADFEAWAESYQALRHSSFADQAVEYHVQRLKDLYRHKAALWPLDFMPQQATDEDLDAIDLTFHAPGLIELKKAHPSIMASIVLKAAMALIAIKRTGHTHAIFNNFEAGGDRLPFVSDSLYTQNEIAFGAFDINGPTHQIVTNLVEARPDDTALSFLDRMQKEQAELTNHAHAPLRHVIEALNVDGNGSGDMIIEAQRTCVLSWVPGLLDEYENIEVLQLVIRAPTGIALIGSLGGPKETTYFIGARWDAANFSESEMEAYLEDLKRTILWLIAKENWYSPIGELL